MKTTWKRYAKRKNKAEEEGRAEEKGSAQEECKEKNKPVMIAGPEEETALALEDSAKSQGVAGPHAHLKSQRIYSDAVKVGCRILR